MNEAQRGTYSQRFLTPHQRFWQKVDKNGPVPDYAPHLGQCWLWTGCLVEGYGQFAVANSQRIYAHRWAYEQEHGPIPTGLQIDHLCRVHACVRASHMETVTGRINVLRGHGPTAHNARVTHCRQGHPYDLFNTYCYPDGRRYCRKCRVTQRHRYEEKHALEIVVS